MFKLIRLYTNRKDIIYSTGYGEIYIYIYIVIYSFKIYIEKISVSKINGNTKILKYKYSTYSRLRSVKTHQFSVNM